MKTVILLSFVMFSFAAPAEQLRIGDFASFECRNGQTALPEGKKILIERPCSNGLPLLLLYGSEAYENANYGQILRRIKQERASQICRTLGLAKAVMFASVAAPFLNDIKAVSFDRFGNIIPALARTQPGAGNGKRFEAEVIENIMCERD
jgi:hypothetical protein